MAVNKEEKKNWPIKDVIKIISKMLLKMLKVAGKES